MQEKQEAGGWSREPRGNETKREEGRWWRDEVLPIDSGWAKVMVQEAGDL